MTISDEEEGIAPSAASEPSALADAEGGVASELVHSVVTSRKGEPVEEESEDEDDAEPSFAGDFEFESSQESDEEEYIHAWDLKEAKEASRQVAPTGASALRDKIAATLRRKGGQTAAEEQSQRDAAAAAAGKRGGRASESQRSSTGDHENGVGVGSHAKADIPAKDSSSKRKTSTQSGPAPRAASSSTWDQLELCRPLLRAIRELGFERPTPIQAEAVPAALAGRDICGAAVTGSGKTAAFMLPVLERLVYRPRRVAATRVLVVTPTRELAIQIHAMTGSLGRHTDVRAAMAVGGLSLTAQETALRTKPDVVIGTPGRLIDLFRNSLSISMEELEILILDEADRLLDLGFAEEVAELVKLCPRGRQTMLFSATMSTEIAELAGMALNNPLNIRADAMFATAAGLRQQFVRLKKGADNTASREAVLLALATRSFKTKTIVFFRSKKQAHRVTIVRTKLLGCNIAASY